MSIVIEQVLGPAERGVRAVVDHAGERLTVSVAADLPLAIESVGRLLNVELGFEQVLGWRVLRDCPPAHHGLFEDPTEVGAVRVVGTVHHILALEDGASIFDVYVQAGPEFLMFQSTDLAGRPPALRDAIEVIVRGPCFYPTWV
jgi:hypothetical protein